MGVETELHLDQKIVIEARLVSGDPSVRVDGFVHVTVILFDASASAGSRNSSAKNQRFMSATTRPAKAR